MWRYVDLFEWADGGNFPVAGGVLNQSRLFMLMYRLWRRFSRAYKSDG